MSQASFSLEHRLAELRQTAAELRAGRFADQVRKAGRSTSRTDSRSFRDMLSALQAFVRPSRLATH
jgi:hypothetical protein